MGARYSKHRHKPRISKQQIPWLLRGAIRSNNVETLQYLLSYPNDVDPSMIIDGVCPLNLAIELGHLQMVRILIKAGANIHVPDAPRYPVLQASMFGRAEIMELLLRSGCDVNTKNESCETGLHLLANQTSERYVSTARILMEHECDPNVLDNSGLAPLHKASPDMTRLLVQFDCVDCDIESEAGDTPLTSAAKDRREGVVMELVKSKRCNLDKTDKIGMTPLMISADAGNTGLNMAKSLLNSAADVSLTDKMGMTALHYSCYVGALAMVQLLMNSSQEQLNLRDKYGRTPVYLATCRGHTEVVNFLLSKGVDIHLTNKENKSPLYISAYFGHLEIANALLRSGAKVDQADSHNKTALYVATYHGRSDIVNLLINCNTNVNAADKNGKTSLYIAVLHGHLHIAEKLIRNGASVNKPDKDGLAPLHMAVKFPKLDIPMVKLLLNHGCDPLNLHAFTKWLLDHSIIPEDFIHGDDEFASWLKREESNVRSLKRLCRSEIQRILGHTDSMKHKVVRLPLPPQLQSYVSLKAL